MKGTGTVSVAPTSIPAAILRAYDVAADRQLRQLHRRLGQHHLGQLHRLDGRLTARRTRIKSPRGHRHHGRSAGGARAQPHPVRGDMRNVILGGGTLALPRRAAAWRTRTSANVFFQPDLSGDIISRTVKHGHDLATLRPGMGTGLQSSSQGEQNVSSPLPRTSTLPAGFPARPD